MPCTTAEERVFEGRALGGEGAACRQGRSTDRHAFPALLATTVGARGLASLPVTSLGADAHSPLAAAPPISPPPPEECKALGLGKPEPHPVIAHMLALKAAQAEQTAAAVGAPAVAASAAAAPAVAAKVWATCAPTPMFYEFCVCSLSISVLGFQQLSAHVPAFAADARRLTWVDTP